MSTASQSKRFIEENVQVTFTLSKYKAKSPEGWEKVSAAAMADIQRRASATHFSAELPDNVSVDEYIAKTLQAQFDSEAFRASLTQANTSRTAGAKPVFSRVEAAPLSNWPPPGMGERKPEGSFSLVPVTREPRVYPASKPEKLSGIKDKVSIEEDLSEPNAADTLTMPPSGNARLSDTEHDRLERQLAENGLCQLYMDGDGNCQFRSLAHQLYKDPLKHRAVRQAAVREMKRHKAQYSPYVEGSFEEYVESMGKDGTWGDHITLQAAAEAFKIKILLVTADVDNTMMEVSPARSKAKKEVTLSYYNGRHFNSTIAAGQPSATKRLKSKARWTLKLH